MLHTNKITLAIVAFLLLFHPTGAHTDSRQSGETVSEQPNAPIDLRCEFLTDPLSVDTPEPCLAWKLTAGNGQELKQTAWQILAATEESLLGEGKADLWDSGKTPSDNQTVKYSGKKSTGSKLVYWKVRIYDGNGRPSPWSRTARFGTGLTAEEWNAAAYIAFPESELPQGNERGTVSPLLHQQFKVKKVATALLYVNSLGYHEIYINGKRVGDYVLAPAVSQFNQRSLYMTYDITPYLKNGVNDLVVWLGKGWYSMGLPGVVHNGPAVKMILKSKDKNRWVNVLQSDRSWLCAASGYETLGSWSAGQFGGERVDASVLNEPADISDAPDASGKLMKAFSLLSWRPVEEIKIPAHAVSPQMVEGNVISEEIKPYKITQLSDRSWLIDMGKVFTGRAKIKFHHLSRAHEVAMKFGDHFNAQGELQNQSQRDYYLASGHDGESFCNRFNYHCFQYIQIDNLPAAPSVDDITGYAIQTGYGAVSSFQCSDPDLNAIHNMIQRTLCNLSLGGYLVDCTHIERLGYGGDGHASTVTAQTMFNLAPLYANWLQAWEDCIRDDGGLPHTAPNPYPAGGGPYWCAFIVTAPWNTYLQYGDLRILEKYYPVMKHWLQYVDKYTVNGLLKPWPETNYRTWYLGDWATPTGVNQTDPESVDLVNNCVVGECYILLEKIARLLGKDDEAQQFSDRKSALDKKIQATFYKADATTYATGSQIDHIYPLLTGVTPGELIPSVTQSLFNTTESRYKGHLATGLVGIPVLVEWAVRNNHPDFVYKMLKKHDYPGYLFMLDNGATATWEHWNGERSRLHNCYNGIGSWFYEAIGGIRLDESTPGYRKIIIEPQIPEGITWAKVTKETPYGTVSVHWECKDRRIYFDVSLPPGCSADIVLPKGMEQLTTNN
ncbi:MAG: glycoside hydrolase family 78 protein [Tannerella sp.]|jgi:alpha-L-rhamnosidase|nr:glycoside hydrolase family 78 protein [Tannerella sp.]